MEHECTRRRGRNTTTPMDEEVSNHVEEVDGACHVPSQRMEMDATSVGNDGQEGRRKDRTDGGGKTRNGRR